MVARPITDPRPAPRVAIYCRVSDPNATDKYGMDSQEAECRAYAAARGWEVAALYREWWSGAELFERPRMTELREAVRRRGVDVLLVHRLDRLSRDVNHQGYILAEVEHAGAAWASATEDIDNSPMGGILRAVIGAFAEMDRLKIVANTRRGMQAKLAAGRPVGTGVPAYGLRWGDAEKPRYAEDPDTIGHLRRIFADCNAGLSVRAIGRGLEADGILPPYHTRTGGTRWSPATVRHILRDRAYLGECVWSRTTFVKAPTGETTRVARPDAEHVALPAGVMPRVIDPALFDRVQCRLDGNQRESPAFRQTRNPEVAILRRGYAVCGHCGHPLVVGRNKSGTVYRCNHDAKRLYGCPGGGVIPVDELDTAIRTWLVDTLSDEAPVARHVARLREADPTGHDLDGLDRQRRDIERQQTNLAAVAAQLGGHPDAVAPLVAQLGALGKQLQANGRDRAALLARQAAWRRAQANLDDVQASCRRVAKGLEAATTYRERRKRVERLRVRFELYRADHKPRWIATSEVIPDAATDANLFNTTQILHGRDAPLQLRLSAAPAEAARDDAPVVSASWLACPVAAGCS